MWAIELFRCLTAMAQNLNEVTIMLPTKKMFYYVCYCCLLASMLSFATLGFAQTETGGAPAASTTSEAPSYTNPTTPISAVDMIINFSKQIPSLTRLATAVACVAGGMFLFFNHYAVEAIWRTTYAMSGSILKRPIIFIIMP